MIWFLNLIGVFLMMMMWRYSIGYSILSREFARHDDGNEIAKVWVIDVFLFCSRFKREGRCCRQEGVCWSVQWLTKKKETKVTSFEKKMSSRGNCYKCNQVSSTDWIWLFEWKNGSFSSQVILPENVQMVMVVVEVRMPIWENNILGMFFRWTRWIWSTRFDLAVIMALQPLNLYL